tara:strand:+ start:278 stop:730 length:453 start_codon:yes stop_codon:yes gene_type:complete
MKYIEDIDLGDEFGPVQIEVKPNDVIDFCKTWIRDEENSKNIFNAAPTRFTDEEFAKTEGLPGAIVPGIMSMAYLARLLNTAWPDGTITQLDVVFRQLVLHNQIINLVGVVTDTVSEDDQNFIECDVYIENSEGSRLVGGKARLDIPSKN